MIAFFGTLLKIHCKNHLRETTAQQLHPDYVTIATPNFSCSNGVSFTHSQHHPITQLLDLPQASPSAALGLHQWFTLILTYTCFLWNSRIFPSSFSWFGKYWFVLRCSRSSDSSKSPISATTENKTMLRVRRNHGK